VPNAWPGKFLSRRVDEFNTGVNGATNMFRFQDSDKSSFGAKRENVSKVILQAFRR
jgi:hypothetical protein